MKSKVTIGVDYDNTPVLKVEYVPSDDVRDILVERFVNAFGAASSWGKFRMVEMKPGAVSDVHSSLSVIRPLMPIEMEGHARLMTVWARHLKDTGVQMMTDEDVNIDPCPGGMGVNGEVPTIFVRPQFTKGMVIKTEGEDYYKCICADEESAVFGRILKWTAEVCRTSFEIMVVYSQEKIGAVNYRVITEPILID